MPTELRELSDEEMKLAVDQSNAIGKFLKEIAATIASNDAAVILGLANGLANALAHSSRTKQHALEGLAEVVAILNGVLNAVPESMWTDGKFAQTTTQVQTSTKVLNWEDLMPEGSEH